MQSSASTIRVHELSLCLVHITSTEQNSSSEHLKLDRNTHVVLTALRDYATSFAVSAANQYEVGSAGLYA